MLATQPGLRESYSPQQQYADNLALGEEDRICPGCKLSAVTEEGGLVVAFGSSFFHVDCFRCAKCSNKVTADTNLLLLSDGSPICANCSYSCNVCKLPILDEAIMTGDDSYHAHCFKCKVCKNRIDELVFAKTSQGIYCMNCHNERMIRIRKHTQKKAEREREKERERNALNGSANSRDRDMKLREDRGRPSSGNQEVTSLKQNHPSRGSLSDRIKTPSTNHLNGQYVVDGFQSGQPSDVQLTPTYPISVTVAPPSDKPETPNNHLPVFQPPPRTSSVDQDRSTPIKKNTAPANSYPSLADLEPRRSNSADDFPAKAHRSSSGSTDIPHISVPSANGSAGSLGVTSRADKRRSINPGLVLENFKSLPDSLNSTGGTPALSPSSAGIKPSNHSATIPSQNGYESSRAPSPFRDRPPLETYSRPGSSQSSHPPHSPTAISQHSHEGSRTRPTSTEATPSDDQTVVIRPPLRSSASESHSTRMHRDSRDRLPAQVHEDRSSSHRRSGQRLSSTSGRSASASQSRPNSRADVPHSIESATESETDNETQESVESRPPAPPPKEIMNESVYEDSDVHPLADLLSLKSDEQESSVLSQPESDETSESSPVEQTSHATYIAPALPPIRFSLNGADFSDLFTSVSGLPPLQQLAQLASVTEQKQEGEDQTPITPPPTASTIARSVSETTHDRQLREGNPSLNSVANHSAAHTRGRSSSEARADSLKKMQAPSQLSLATIGSDATQITISPPTEADDKQEKYDDADLVLNRLQEVLADARDRGAQQLKLDRGFIEAIIQGMTTRKADFSELKGNLDGMKRASKQYMEGLTVAQTEYDRELKQRRELEAEVTRLRVLLSGQAARLTALSGDSRRQELRQQMTKELNKNLTGLEQDLSKLKVQRDMTLAEMEEIFASKSESSGQEPGSSLSRNLTRRLDNLKTQYQRDLIPLTQEREALAREIMELKAARDIFLEETTVLNARNEELAQLSAQYARRMASASDAPPKSQEKEEPPLDEKGRMKSRPPPITIQHSSHTRFPSQPSQPQAPVPQPPVNQPMSVQPLMPPPPQMHPPPPAQLNLPQADEQLTDSRGTPSKPPRFMKWGVSRSKDPIAPPSHAKRKLEHNFQPLSLLRFTRCDHCGDKMWGSQLRCTGCNVSVHTRCVGHVQSYCSQQSHTSQEDSQPLPPSMFGRDLVEQVRSDAKGGPRQVPVIVEKCIQAVEALGMEYEGIYRKTGGSGQSRVITQLFERGDYDAFDLCDEDKFNDICSVTSVLKTYLRSLPVPLFTHDLHDHFMSAVEIKDVETKNSTLTDLVNKLPAEHYHTLRMLMLHLSRIRERCDVNLMNARNLGVVFGPTLMRSRTPGAEFSDMAGKALSVEWMVENATNVFT
ncbi:RhoGAP-domain-containing protein [Marasmius fiardii PR-910]|nr:RhoGAP-domain-containing protein [Marasmius fiardii PR-910]